MELQDGQLLEVATHQAMQMMQSLNIRDVSTAILLLDLHLVMFEA